MHGPCLTELLLQPSCCCTANWSPRHQRTVCGP